MPDAFKQVVLRFKEIIVRYLLFDLVMNLSFKQSIANTVTSPIVLAISAIQVKNDHHMLFLHK